MKKPCRSRSTPIRQRLGWSRGTRASPGNRDTFSPYETTRTQSSLVRSRFPTCGPLTSSSTVARARPFSFVPYSLAYQAETGAVIGVLADSYSAEVVSFGSDGKMTPLLLGPFSMPWINRPLAVAPAASGGTYALWAVNYPGPSQAVE